MPESRIHEQLGTEWQELLAGLPSERVASSRWFLGPFRYGHTGMARPTVLFAELEDVRATWNELRASGHLEEFADRFITTAWTLKDLLAHLASWAVEIGRQVETAAAGQVSAYVIAFDVFAGGPDEWNETEVQKRRPRSLEALLDEFETETRRLQDLVLKLPEETLLAETESPLAPTGDPAGRWKTNIARIVAAKCGHDRLHMGRIQQLLASQTERHR